MPGVSPDCSEISEQPGILYAWPAAHKGQTIATRGGIISCNAPGVTYLQDGRILAVCATPGHERSCDIEPHTSPKRILTESFANFLGGDAFDWDSFGTFTFAEPRARRAIDSLAYMLRSLVRSQGGYIRAFIAEEFGNSGGRRHLHALVEHPGRRGREIKDQWELKRGTGFARVAQFSPRGGAAKYVTKYVIKDAHGVGDWDLVDYGKKVRFFEG